MFELILKNGINFELYGVEAINFYSQYGIKSGIFRWRFSPTLHFSVDEVMASPLLRNIFKDSCQRVLKSLNGKCNDMLDVPATYKKDDTILKSNAKELFYNIANKAIDELIRNIHDNYIFGVPETVKNSVYYYEKYDFPFNYEVIPYQDKKYIVSDINNKSDLENYLKGLRFNITKMLDIQKQEEKIREINEIEEELERLKKEKEELERGLNFTKIFYPIHNRTQLEGVLRKLNIEI